MKKKIERFVADDIKEATWLRLNRLTSAQLCTKIIKENNPDLHEDIIRKKAEGMSSTVRSAFGYWNTKEGGLNSKILSRYYAILQITLAEQIASKDPKADIGYVQKHTEAGHGLFLFRDEQIKFPENMLIGCLNSGHFTSYLRNLNLPIKQYASEKRPKKREDIDFAKVISLPALLSRIPELQGVVGEYLNRNPMSFQFGYSDKNVFMQRERMEANLNKDENITYAYVYSESLETTADELNKYGFEIKNIRSDDTDRENGKACFIGDVHHPANTIWWDYVESYKSNYCGTSVIVPFWEIKDPFVLHLTVLYAFSIIVRYLPEMWYEIEYGKDDYFRALLEHYLVVVDNVLPRLALERLTGVRLSVSQAGGFNAPI